MTNDERVEHDLVVVLREGAPTMTPSSLRDRVATTLAAEVRPWRRRYAPVLGAAAVVAVLLAAAFAGPNLLRAPGQTAAASDPTTAPVSADASIRTSTELPSVAPPTTQPLAEPIDDPGLVNVGTLLTPADGWVVDMEGRLLVTHSAGASWRDITPQGVDGGMSGPMFVDPSHGWLVELRNPPTPDLKIWRTTDAGVTWTSSILKGLGHGNGAPVFLTPTLGWLATDLGGDPAKPELRWTFDGGSTWLEPIDLAEAAGIETYQPMMFVDGQVGFISGGGIFQRTTDGGQTWADIEIAPQTMPLTPDTRPLLVGLPTFRDANRGVVQVGLSYNDDGTAAGGQVYSTSDGGATWQLVFNDPLHRQWRFIDEVHWVAIDGEHVWSTSDGGRTITSASSSGLPFPLGRTYGAFVDPLHGWLTADGACPVGYYCALSFNWLYKTSDGGRTWATVGDCPYRCAPPGSDAPAATESGG